MITMILKREIGNGQFETIVIYGSGRTRTYKPGEKICKSARDFMIYHVAHEQDDNTLIYK